MEFFNLSKEERIEIGRKGRAHVLENYGFAKYTGQWYQLLKETVEELGSWDTRKKYNRWEMIEIK